VLLVVISTLLVALTHILLKVAVGRSDSVMLLLFDPLLVAALIVTFAGGMLLVYALKHGELSALYPIISLGFVWVALEGVLLFDEKLSPFGIAGILTIIAGVSLIGHTSMRQADRGRKKAHNSTDTARRA